MTAEQIEAFLEAHFPAAIGFCRISAIRDEEIDCVVPYSDSYLRPGGTLSGPTLMTLADTAVFFLILAKLGPIGLAVTTSLNINFLRKPPPGPLLARCRLLKLGKRLAVAEVHIAPHQDGDPVAQATATYSIPPR
jgi:uncharacterized protein (TIGR00369 family)